MAILVFFPYLPYPSYHSGASALVYQLLSRLGRQEEVDLVVFEHPGICQRDVDHVRSRVDNLFILPFSIPGQRRCLIRHFLKMSPVGPSLRRHIKSLLDKKNYRKIICASYLSTIIIGRKYADRTIALPIDAFSRLHRQLSRTTAQKSEQLKHRFSARLFAHFEKSELHLFSKSLLVSSQDCRYLNRLNRQLKCEAIPLGIESQRFQAGLEKREPFSLLFTGNFAYLPNHQAALYLLQLIMPRLSALNSEIRLYLVGIHPSREMLTYRNHQVIIPGYEDDIDRFYRTCQLFICPLLCGTGIKNKILEAGAAGMPILASPLSLEGLDLDRNVFQTARNADEYCSKAMTLLTDPFQCQKLGSLGRAQITSRYDWKNLIGRFADTILS